jgi:hypothetical protein
MPRSDRADAWSGRDADEEQVAMQNLVAMRRLELGLCRGDKGHLQRWLHVEKVDKLQSSESTLPPSDEF